MEPAYKVPVTMDKAAIQPLLSVSSKFPIHASAQECAKSIIKTNWIRMNKNPPIIPKYIHTSPKKM